MGWSWWVAAFLLRLLSSTFPASEPQDGGDGRRRSRTDGEGATQDLKSLIELEKGIEADRKRLDAIKRKITSMRDELHTKNINVQSADARIEVRRTSCFWLPVGSHWLLGVEVIC